MTLGQAIIAELHQQRRYFAAFPDFMPPHVFVHWEVGERTAEVMYWLGNPAINGGEKCWYKVDGRESVPCESIVEIRLALTLAELITTAVGWQPGPLDYPW